MELLLVRCLLRLLGCVFMFEQAGQPLNSLSVPGVELRWMHSMLGGDLGDRLFFLEQFQHEMGLLFGGVLFSHSG